MKNNIIKVQRFIKSKLILILLIVLVVFIGLFFVKKNNGYEMITVSEQDFVQTLEISGRVVPVQDLNLSFEVVGKVLKVNYRSGDFVRAGQVLAELDISEVSGELNEALSNLEKERIALSNISGDDFDQNKLQNESQNLISMIKKSYITSDDIIKNVVDIFFRNPNNRFPDFNNVLSNWFLRQDINEKRYEVGVLLIDWKKQIDKLNETNLSYKDAIDAVNNLKSIESFLALITSEVTDFIPDSLISQTQVDSYITGVSNARRTVSSLVLEINSTYDSYQNILSDIPIKESNIIGAEASVQRLSAKRNKYILRAPFDGLITDRDIEVGQVVSAGESVISMISDNSFEIEGFVPEINIIGVDVDDEAEIILDAFGDDNKFEAVVSQVDQRETIKDGVTTYKVILNFTELIPEIRSGMTADIKIKKSFIPNQIIISRYLISSDQQGDYVEIPNGKNSVRKYIKVGLIDGRGGIIVEEGIEVGEQIIIPNK